MAYEIKRKTASGTEDIKLPYSILADAPTMGNGTITIKQAGTVKGTFTTNQSGNTTIELANSAVIQSPITTNGNYPILAKNTTATSQTTNTTIFSKDVYVNPSTGTVYANDFVVDGQSIVGGGSSLPLVMEEENYSIASGDEFTLEVPATDYMPLFIEIYISQDTGYDYPPILQLFNTDACDSIEIPYTYGRVYSIVAKPNGSNFDIYIRKSDGTISYLDSMCMEYIYLNSPYSQGWSYDTEITVKICCINTIV